MSPESSPTREAPTDGDTHVLCSQGSTEGGVLNPNPRDEFPTPDGPTCMVLRRWTYDTLKLAGISQPGSMTNALREMCRQASKAADRKEAVLNALALLDGVRSTPEISELRAALTSLCHPHDEPHPQPSVGPAEDAGPAQANPSCSGQPESVTAAPGMVDGPVEETDPRLVKLECSRRPVAVTAEPAEVDMTADTIPMAKVVIAAKPQTQSMANTSDTTTVMIPIAGIITDAGTQVRTMVSAEVVEDYRAAMADGNPFPPIIVFGDAGHYYLADGNHRLRASEKLGRTEIAAKVYAGTSRDALWHALTANRTNGMRLSTQDKAFAVVRALQEFPEKSQTQIAEHVGCAQSYVHKVKQSITSGASPSRVPQAITGDNLARPARVTGKDGKSYPAARESKARKGEGRTPQADSTDTQRDAPLPAGNAIAARQAPATGTTSAQVAVPTAVSADQQRWVDQLWQVASAKPRSDWPVIAEAMRVVIDMLEDGEAGLSATAPDRAA